MKTAVSVSGGKDSTALLALAVVGRGIGVRSVVEWSKTSRGGGQYDLLRAVEATAGCSSVYGLCE